MLSALFTALPFLLRIANLVMDWIGMKEEEKRKYFELITSAKDDSLTPIQRKDEIADLKAKLKARLAKGPE